VGRPSKAEPFRSFVVEQLAKEPELLLGGHPKPATDGQLKTGHHEG
jgi:hypothetical protein